MKKSTKKIFIIIMSIALVSCNFVVFSMVKDGKVGDAGKTTSASAENSDNATDNEANSEPGTEVNLENVNGKLIVTDADGNDIELSDVDVDKYDGFIYKLNDGDTLTADSLEDISDAVSANSIEYVEPNYKAELLELDAEDYEVMTDSSTESNADSVEEISTNNCDEQEVSTETGNSDEDSTNGVAELDSGDYSPNDPYYNSYGWVQKLVKADKVWNKGCFGSKDVTVAVIDSGVDSTHSDLGSSSESGCEILTGHYFVSGKEGSGAQDNYWHGTFCTGLIAATHNNGIGNAGETPNVTILPIKVFDSSNGSSTYGGYISDISEAIKYATDNGADVISMSLGITYSAPQTLNDACQYAVNKGVILVAAAGNDYSRVKNYPASFDNVISVGSVDSDKSKSSFSNYNEKVDVVAGGRSVYGLCLNNGYKTANGTSFSTPQVAALAAMLKSQYPNINEQGVEEILSETCVDLYSTKLENNGIGRDIYYGWGLVDFEKASEYEDNGIYRCSIEVNDENLICDGTKKTLDQSNITVKDGDETLKLNQDYVIEGFYSNVNAGLAAMKIKGIGRYSGTATINYTILPTDITPYKNLASVANATYSGYGQQPSTSVVGVDGSKLTKGTDYTVSYRNNVNVCDGTAVATISGTGNYTGSFELKFSIEKANIADFGAVGSATYTGGALRPKLYNMSGLKLGSDYTASYSSNVNLGYGYVKITAIGNNTYGSKTLKFKIIPKGATNKNPGRAKKAVTVKWSMQKAKMPKKRVTGYKVQVAKNSKFTSGVKTKTVKGYSKTSKKITGLSRKTKYYTRVRTYIKTSYGTLYSNWSGVKATTTK